MPKHPEISAPLVVLLGAGRPYRGTPPSALQAAPDQRAVLDWIRDAFSTRSVAWHFVGGYHLGDVVRRYPGMGYSINVDWETTGAVASLFQAPLREGRTHYVAYTDVVFDADAVRRLESSGSEVAVAVDGTWRSRYQRRRPEEMQAAEKVRVDNDRVVSVSTGLPLPQADAEFTGLLKLSPEATRRVLQFRSENPEVFARAGIPDLINALIDAGCDCAAVDVDGRWAELNAPQDLARFVLGTKAETLERLRPMVRRSRIGEQVAFTVADWRADAETVVERVRSRFPAGDVVVRSSALSEDSWSTANAGAFLSLMDVPVHSEDALSDAIERVAASFVEQNPADQILIQRMLGDVVLSGVVFTRTLSAGAPYCVINYDATPGTTSSVTSGTGRDLETLIVSRGTHALPPAADARLGSLLPALEEIEALVGHDSLDVEFAISSEEVLHILQVRPIAVDHRAWRMADAEVEAATAAAERQFRARQSPAPFLSGDRAIFGIMPDWNPAEIIGTKPRRLAMSLYRYLIMDEVWAASRAELGYRDVRPRPLLVCFAGHPYVDVRASFSSFVPAGLPDALSARLVNGYLERLAAAPHLHDKVEFEIAITCLTLDFDVAAERLREDGLSAGEIGAFRAALTTLTRNAFRRVPTDLERIEVAEARRKEILAAGLPPLAEASLLLEDARRATLPFSNLARLGFIATALLRSAVRTGVIDSGQLDAFMESLNTVARQYSLDGSRVASGELSWDDYRARYGHLRPGTYEITSPCYASDPERFLRPMVAATPAPAKCDRYELRPRSRKAFESSLRGAGLIDESEDLDGIERFCRAAIEGRESSKFAFTRSLSSALESIAGFGESLGLTREEMSHIAVDDLLGLELGMAPAERELWLRGRAEEGEREHRLAQAVELPPLLTADHDFRAFVYPRIQPNFVGRGRATAALVDLTGGTSEPSSLGGHIVLIPQADPGFDWLFGQRIAGLVTMYGGANSHMAIRAAEIGLPAAIGVGESLYQQYRHAHVLELDCSSRVIRVLR